MKSIEEISPIIQGAPRNIVITMHSKPDGDALGSALAMYHYLVKKGHMPTVLSPSDYGLYLHWMPGNSAVVVYPEQKEKAHKLLKEAEFIFCLDFSQLSRVEFMEQALRKAEGVKIMLDHHLDPEGFDAYRMWNPDACATAELVYAFMEKMGDIDLLDKNIATCLYTGLVTDSGSFRYPNVTADVHRITARLIEAGVEHSNVHRLLFDTFTEQRIRFFGHCISNRLVVLPEYRAAYIYVSREELKQYDIRTGDTEGLVNYPMSLSEVVFAGLIIERDTLVKLSLRSKGQFPANEFAGKYFNGGGHLNAAGGSFRRSLGEAVDTFLQGLEEYKQLLLNC